MQEQGLLWIQLPYLQTATPAIPLDMTILRENLEPKLYKVGSDNTTNQIQKIVLNISRVQTMGSENN